MSLRHSLTAVGAGLSLVAGGVTFCNALRGRWEQTRTIVSQAGRDQALIQLLQGARKSVYLRTEGLTLVPAGNELAQAVQRNVGVTVELPLDASLSPGDSMLPRMLIELGAVVTFRSDQSGNYRGTYLEIDGERFLYSAASLRLNSPGAFVSYVVGPILR